MSCDITEDDGTLLVRLHGDIDLEHADGVRDRLLDCVARGKDLRVDLSQVDYIDSSGIATLVEALQLAKDNGTALVLAAVSTQAQRVLKLARLDKVFTILETPAASPAGGG